MLRFSTYSVDTKFETEEKSFAKARLPRRERESCDAPNTKLKWSESSEKSRIEKIAFSCFFFLSEFCWFIASVWTHTHTHAHNGEELYTCMNNATEQRNTNEIFLLLLQNICPRCHRYTQHKRIVCIAGISTYYFVLPFTFICRL